MSVTPNCVRIVFISLTLVGTQLIEAHFSAAVRGAVVEWRQGYTFEDAVRQLSDPNTLGASLTPLIDHRLNQSGVPRPQLVAHAWSVPCVVLRSAFDASDLPDTPTDFCPVPDREGTLLARATAIGAIAALGSNTVSYGCENNGELFVNLVVIPGKGKKPEKSKKNMKGHTDGVWFPIRGEVHPFDPRVAPSPDFVCLCGLRNPDEVATKVMSLPDVINRLTLEEVEELKKSKYSIGPQGTYQDALIALYGRRDVSLSSAQLLYTVAGDFWIRYSHSSVIPDDGDDAKGEHVIAAFESACLECAQLHPIGPGDIALVNNRIALHGRESVGDAYGGKTRWLMRTYALDTSELNDTQRHPHSHHMLYP